MRSPLSGPIATLFMFIPLVAVPLLAIFGMPQFSTLLPPAQVEDLRFASEKERPAPKPSQQEGDLVGGVQMTDSSTASQPPGGTAARSGTDSDPFAEFMRSPDAENARPEQQGARPAKKVGDNRNVAHGQRPQHWPSDENNAAGKDVAATAEPGFEGTKTGRTDQDRAHSETSGSSPQEQKRSKAATRMTAGFDANDQDPAPDLTASNGGPLSKEAKSWKAAIARLNALGIRDYQIQPGEREGDFLFRCRFVSRNNPRVTQDFEAEAGEPLKAVQQVLQQIDEWKGRRSEARNRAASRTPAPNVTALASPDEAVPLSAVDVSNR